MSPISDDRSRWLARFVLPHEARLRAWLGRRVPVGFEVDDIVQESYAILAAKADVAEIRNPRTYMFQVAYSVMLQQLRHARVVPIVAVADIGLLEAAEDQPSPERTVQARDDLRTIQAAIAAMPRQTRQAFVLRRVEGLSQREIAGQMRLSVHTVEKHIARGIKILMEQVRQGGDEAPDASKVETEIDIRDPASVTRK